ncbi:MAG: OmpH family outer membrane protein [Deltaproteobacteria bacterium]|nr:OmpH family outer membrane protein [Deltaproteobacteria bacterium]
MKRFWVLLLFGFAALFMTAETATAQAIKIGVVDIQKFQKKSKAFQSTSAKLKTKFDALQKKLDDERAALLKLEDDFKKQSMMLSLDAQGDKRRELDKKRRYYKYLYEELTLEMKDLEQETTGDVGKELEKVVKKIAEKEGYTLILEKRTLGLIYFSSTIDITDRVVSAYDASKP